MAVQVASAYVEALINGAGGARVASAYVEALTNGGTNNALVASSYVEVLRAVADAPTRRRQMVLCQ